MATVPDISTLADPAPDGPTADDPGYGTIGIYNQPISDVAYWIEGGDHVFRSVEFDIIAGAPDFDEAISKFIDNAEDLATSIAELDGDDRTAQESQDAMTIFQRLAGAYEESERIEQERRRRMRLLRLLRRRPDSHRGFRPSSSPRTSSPAPLV